MSSSQRSELELVRADRLGASSSEHSEPNPPASGPASGPRGIATHVARSALVGALIFAATEFTSVRRAYLAYETLRRFWSALQRARQAGSSEQGRAAAPLPSAEPPRGAAHDMERLVDVGLQNVVSGGRFLAARSRAAFDGAAEHTRRGLDQPAVSGLLVGGSVLGAAASLGALPAALAAGTAFATYRALSACASREKPRAGARRELSTARPAEALQTTRAPQPSAAR